MRAVCELSAVTHSDTNTPFFNYLCSGILPKSSQYITLLNVDAFMM